MRKGLLAALATLGLSVAAAYAVGPANSARPDTAASPASAERAQIRCGRTRNIGLAAPLTGAAASLGQQQARWVRFFVTRWNRTHPRARLRIISGDTQLPDTAQAVQVAERLAANARVLGVVGPAGSQEVQVSTAPFRQGGLVYISGSATRTSLTTDGTRRGRFFRVVPNDDQQGPRVVNHIRRVMRATRIVVVDGQDAYSEGLSDFVERALRARGGVTVQRESVNPETTTDFSSLVTRIPANTQVIYIPWQLAPKAQLFGQQLRAAGRRATLFGSDGLFDPDNFKIPGSLISFFPVQLNSSEVANYRSGPGRRKTDAFGIPSCAAADVLARAIHRACRDNNATRLEVRRLVAQTNIPKAQSILGFQIRFVQRAAAPLGPGDMRRPADFAIYRINNRGVYVRIS